MNQLNQNYKFSNILNSRTLQKKPTLCGIFVNFLFEIWLLGGFQIDKNCADTAL